MTATGLAGLAAAAAGRMIAAGEISSRELVAACLERIESVDGEIGAWTHLDPEHALEQARQADRIRAHVGASGRGVLGPLHGVPVGIKDIFDTHDMPTENGSVLHAGRAPNQDSTAVARLRAAGAVIMGKTVTTEFAAYAPGKTRNPHDPSRTPGGSSSGSAAAVASSMVPLAIGSQTNGSTIRPASFCGIYGYKPTHGLISRHRMFALSRLLDHVGMFARSVADLALIADALMSHDGNDPDVAAGARRNLSEVAAQAPPSEPRLAFVKSPLWDRVEDSAQAAIAALADSLGARVEKARPPAPFEMAAVSHKIIFETDAAWNLAAEYDSGRERISAEMRAIIERGREHKALDYLRAVEMAHLLRRRVAELLENYDAILTPGTVGEAPKGLEATGDPALCTIWTLAGVPAISVPVMRGESGMPLGAQLVGRPGDDGRLLRTARWLAETVESGQ